MLYLLAFDEFYLNDQKVKGAKMIKIRSPNQLNILDPSDWLTLKRQQMLEGGWPGLFQKPILPTLPVHKAAKFVDASVDRPTRELYAMLGALIPQQAFDLSDKQTVDHFALNITEESDCARYFSPKTLWNGRNIAA